MKILITAPFEEPVPPHKYGGTELVVHNVAEGLVEAGHEVYLCASGDSVTSAHLLPLLPTSMRKMYDVKTIDIWRNYWKMAAIPKILKHIHDIKPDIIHNNMNWRMVLFAPLIDVPMMSTIHGSIDTANERETYKNHPQENYISISNNQRKGMPQLNWVETVYNGIDVKKFDFVEEEGDYFVFLGRTNPEKGLAEICRMIRQTNHKLKIAAKVDSVDVHYFETEVKPFVDGKQIEFLGEIDHEGKNKLLKHAKGLLLWLNWEEPFGLVVTEAMACGTPVIVNKRGSMPELIINNKTGFLVDSLLEMQQRLDEVGSIRRSDCREHVVKNFSREKMVQDYLAVASRLIAQSAHKK